MPLSPGAVKRAEALEDSLRSRIESDPDADDYDAVSNQLATVGRLLNEHYKSQRQTDENGRLTAEPPTRLPASVEGDPESDETGYFYEPNIREVQNFARRTPGALDRLGLRTWAGGISVPEKREAVTDPMSGAAQGWNVVPAVTYLDNLRESDSEYGRLADEMYRLKSEEAQKYGTNLKRYRDIQFRPGQKVDYVAGTAGYVGDRVVAPALMGVADAATLGQATPLGDVLTELIDYEAGKRGIDIGPQPKGQDVIDRNRIAYTGGNLAGYGLPRNPANLIQGQLAEVGNTLAQRAIGSAANTAIPRAAVAAGSAAVTNAFEGASQDFATRAAQSTAGDALGKDLEESAGAAVDNLGLNAAVGGVMGGGLDAAASGINAVRQGYRGQPRNAPLRTLESAGGGAHVGYGVTAPKEIERYYNESNELGAHGTAGDRAARQVAPDIEQSLVKQAEQEQIDIEKETQDYYRHPEYRDIEHNVTPAVQSLVDIAEGSFGRSSIDGSLIPADPPMMKKVGGILNDYAQPVPVSRKDAGSLASTTGGIVMESNVAKHLFGDEVVAGPDQVILLRPIKVNAQGLTAMEGRIDRELGFSANRGDPNDPVWSRFNLGIKQTRDQFPLYRDAEGKLVGPPPESIRPEPFAKDPRAVPPQQEMRVVAPPIDVKGGPQQKPQGLLGVGPGQPDLPSSPFDPRAGITPGAAADQLPRPIGIGGEGMVARPEGLYGVGPGGPSVPDNPFDPRLGTSQEAIRPMMQQNVTGGEYGPPPPLDPNARMGIGPRDNQGPVQSFTEEGLPLPGVSAQKTVNVRGDYNKPREIEPAPTTQRFGIGQRSDELAASGVDEKLYQQEYGPTGITEVSPDTRGGLERSLDEQLERAPKPDQAEIDEIGALQTADREQVAANQKAYVEDIFSPGSEARAREMAKVEKLAQNQQAIEEAMAQLNNIDRRLGPIPDEQKRTMLLDLISKKLGEDVTAEDLIRAGLIATGMVQMATDDGDGETGAAVAGLGLFGRGKKKAGKEGPSLSPRPSKPEQLRHTTKDGKVREGFSALRSKQHDRLTAIEKAKARIGVGKDQTVEDRIRTFGQQEGRLGTDETLLQEATKIGKARELRTAAGAAVYPHMKARAQFGGKDGLWNKMFDFLGLRGYKAGEYLAGRFDNKNTRNPFVQRAPEVNPFWSSPGTYTERIQQSLIEDPARRLLNLSGGSPGARHGDDVRRILEALRGPGYYEENEERSP